MVGSMCGSASLHAHPLLLVAVLPIVRRQRYMHVGHWSAAGLHVGFLKMMVGSIALVLLLAQRNTISGIGGRIPVSSLAGLELVVVAGKSFVAQDFLGFDDVAVVVALLPWGCIGPTSFSSARICAFVW